MTNVKKLVLLFVTAGLLLSLSGCRSAPASSGGPSAGARQNRIVGRSDDKTYPAEWWETDAFGGEHMTPEGEKRASEQYSKFVEISGKIESWIAAHPDGSLAAHFSGISHFNSWDDIIVRVDDLHNEEVLRELEEVGIESDYQLAQGSGSREAGEKAARQMKEAFAALKAKTDPNEEEKLLLTKYRPQIGTYDMLSGIISVELHCDTPWYQQVSSEEMEKDRQQAISLFEKYIGKYDFIAFGFPV